MTDLKVLSGNGPRAAVRALCAEFARATGNAVDVALDVNPEVVRRGKAENPSTSPSAIPRPSSN